MSCFKRQSVTKNAWLDSHIVATLFSWETLCVRFGTTPSFSPQRCRLSFYHCMADQDITCLGVLNDHRLSALHPLSIMVDNTPPSPPLLQTRLIRKTMIKGGRFESRPNPKDEIFGPNPDVDPVSTRRAQQISQCGGLTELTWYYSPSALRETRLWCSPWIKHASATNGRNTTGHSRKKVPHVR